jgi:hypothetical protein
MLIYLFTGASELRFPLMKTALLTVYISPHRAASHNYRSAWFVAT